MTFDEIQSAVQATLKAHLFFTPAVESGKQPIPVVLEREGDILADLEVQLLSLGLGVVILPPVPGGAASNVPGPVYEDCALMIDVVEAVAINPLGVGAETVACAVEHLLHCRMHAGLPWLTFNGRERHEGVTVLQQQQVLIYRCHFTFHEAVNEMPVR